MNIYQIDVLIINVAYDGTRGNTWTKKLYEKYTIVKHELIGEKFSDARQDSFVYETISKIGFYYAYDSDSQHKDKFIRTYYVDFDFGKIEDTVIEYVKGLLIQKIRDEKIDILI